MRLKNKYLRNRAYRIKHWKRIRNTEHPYETYCPYDHPSYRTDIMEQINRHFQWIDERARALENGSHKRLFHSPAWFRNSLNGVLRSRQKHALEKVRHGDYDAEFPIFKRDADWLWF